jgi:hypothetical protein
MLIVLKMRNLDLNGGVHRSQNTFLSARVTEKRRTLPIMICQGSSMRKNKDKFCLYEALIK